MKTSPTYLELVARMRVVEHENTVLKRENNVYKKLIEKAGSSLSRCGHCNNPTIETKLDRQCDHCDVERPCLEWCNQEADMADVSCGACESNICDDCVVVCANCMGEYCADCCFKRDDGYVLCRGCNEAADEEVDEEDEEEEKKDEPKKKRSRFIDDDE